MATVTFSAADDLLYAYLAGEIDHDAAQNLRIQLDDALLARTPKTLVLDLGGVGFMDSWGGADSGPRAPDVRPGWAACCAKRTEYRAPHAGPGAYPLRLIVGEVTS